MTTNNSYEIINNQLISSLIGFNFTPYKIVTKNIKDIKTDNVLSIKDFYYDSKEHFIYSFEAKEEQLYFECQFSTLFKNISQLKINENFIFDLKELNDYIEIYQTIYKKTADELRLTSFFKINKINLQIKCISFKFETQKPKSLKFKDIMTDDLIHNVNKLMALYNLTYSKDNKDKLLDIIKIIDY